MLFIYAYWNCEGSKKGILKDERQAQKNFTFLSMPQHIHNIQLMWLSFNSFFFFKIRICEQEKASAAVKKEKNYSQECSLYFRTSHWSDNLSHYSTFCLAFNYSHIFFPPLLSFVTTRCLNVNSICLKNAFRF